MTRTEERLREAFEAAAQTVRPGVLDPLVIAEPGRRRSVWWIAPVAAAASVGAVVAGTFALRTSPPPSGQQVLQGAASTSEHLPSATGRYWHSKIRRERTLPITVAHDGVTYRLDMHLDGVDDWIARSPADLSWHMEENISGFTAPTAADEAAWRHDGYPTNFIAQIAPGATGADCKYQCYLPTFQRPWPMGKAIPKGWLPSGPSPYVYTKGPRTIRIGFTAHRASVAEVMTLPTDPAQLRTRLQALIDPAGLKNMGRTQAEAMYEAVKDLLIVAPSPPKVRAAAFRLLATFPGIKTLGEARDPLGRHGIALIVTDPSFRAGGAYQERFIIDPTTTKILAVGEQNGPGNQNTYLPVTAAEWTNDTPKLILNSEQTPPSQS